MLCKNSSIRNRAQRFAFFASWLSCNAVLILMITGCGDQSSDSESENRSAESTSDKTTTDTVDAGTKSKTVAKKFTKAKPKNEEGKKDNRSKIVSKSFLPSKSGGGFSSTKSLGGKQRKINRVKAIIDYAADSQSTNSTVVVWLFDVSSSSTTFRDFIVSQMQSTEKLEESKQFESVVASYHDGPVEYPLANPTADFDKVRTAASQLKSADRDAEQTLLALNSCVERFGPLRNSQRKSVIMVLVTDEATKTDDEKIESVSNNLKKYSIPLFVLGNPAPFGREIDAVQSTNKELIYGPETVALERVKIGSWDASTRADRYDSGFGPWALEKLCRDSGGRFLANRSSGRSMRIVSRMQSDWPSTSSKQFEDAIMSKYKPFYGSVAEYQADLQTNKAKQALHQAASQSFSDVYRIQNYEFNAGNEAQLVRAINAAQRTPAVIRPGLEKLYMILKEGEKDRDSLTDPRWQASYDLAYGRVLANYIRVVVLNTMLAELKGGKSFQDPGSNRWVLEPSSEVTSGTGDKRLAEKAKMFLQRVVSDHPGTPWQQIAQRELESPMGWKWTEAKR